MTELLTWQQLNEFVFKRIDKWYAGLPADEKEKLSAEEIEGFYFLDETLRYDRLISDETRESPDGGLMFVKKFKIDPRYKEVGNFIIKYEIQCKTDFVTVYQIG